MPKEPANLLAPLVKKLQNWLLLDDRECRAVLSLPHNGGFIERDSYLVRDGDQPKYSCLILSGFAIRQKLVSDGGMQILAIHMAGDFVDLQNALLGTADHSVQALTEMGVAHIPIEAVLQLVADYPRVGLAFWYDTLVDSAIFREWLVNIGRRSARARVAHLLCEFGVRLEQAGAGDRSDYELPMTQHQLADCTGLTAVHINRTLRGLDADKLIVRTKRSVRIPDWHKLAEAGDFQGRYLQPRHDRLRDSDPLWTTNRAAA